MHKSSNEPTDWIPVFQDASKGVAKDVLEKHMTGFRDTNIVVGLGSGVLEGSLQDTQIYTIKQKMMVHDTINFD